MFIYTDIKKSGGKKTTACVLYPVVWCFLCWYIICEVRYEILDDWKGLLGRVLSHVQYYI